jgi:prophage maintenance system killer protein
LVVEGAREAAAAAGHPRSAPPLALSACRQEIVEAALGRPRAGFGAQELYVGVPAKAAALAYEIVKGHACADGNKRLAVVLSLAFLEANAIWLEASDDEVEHIFRRVAESEAESHDQVLADLTHWFNQATSGDADGS